MADDDKKPYTGAIVPLTTGGSVDSKVPYTGEIVRPKKELEFPDAPTIAHLPLPGTVQLPGAMGRLTGLDQPTMGWGDKAASMFGPMLTDNPQARQEILAKHLPGATPTQDKFGNPMIDYKGKRYYASRPGEFDAMDAGRIATSTAITLPALALGPASIPAAMATNAALNSGQSFAEDALTQVAGGTSQEIDPTKAAVAGGIGMVLPPAANVLLKSAGKLYSRFAPSMLDAAGKLTDKARAFLARPDIGINPDILTADQLKLIDKASRENFGSPQAARSAGNTALGSEFEVPQTRGQITRDPTQVGLEDSLRSSGRGPDARQTMTDFAQRQTEALTDAQNTLRQRVTGQTPMNPQDAGEVLARGFNKANLDAEREVSNIYGASSDPVVQQHHNIPTQVPQTHIADLTSTVENKIAQSKVGDMVLDPDFNALAPWASKALAKVQAWSAAAKDPNSPRIAISWDGIDKMRRQLKPYMEKAIASRDATDISAMKAIYGGFDDHFAGLNPLLDQARAAHADRMATFYGGRDSSTATSGALKTLGLVDSDGNPREPGVAVVNKIFGSMNRGEAEPVIQHLKTVYANDPEAMNTLKDQALRRLFVDADGAALSPQRTRTAIEKAFGDRQGSAYTALFSTEEQNVLKRYLALNQNIADTIKQTNPSGSGHIMGAIMRHIEKRGIGAAAGSAIGALLGGPPGAAAGGMAGATIGNAAESLLAQRAAGRAVNPPANITPDFARGSYQIGAGASVPVRGLLDDRLQQ